MIILSLELLSSIGKTISSTTGFFYLYIYPIVSSILAGFIFWVIFSVLPENKRKKSFNVGITNDLILLNQEIFGFFDVLLREDKFSPSYFQNEIHACSLTFDDVNTALQNKAISNSYLTGFPSQSNIQVMGEEIQRRVRDIDIVINRLYSFNYFLSSNDVTVLRNIYEHIHRYLPYISMNVERTDVIPLNPSLSFMSSALLGLQKEYKALKEIVFKNDLIEREFILLKVLRSFHSQMFVECIKMCDAGLKNFEFESGTVNLFRYIKVNSFFALNKDREAYELLRSSLNEKTDLIGYRNLLFPLLSNPIAYQIISDMVGSQQVLTMKELVESENLKKQNFIAKNLRLKKYFSR